MKNYQYEVLFWLEREQNEIIKKYSFDGYSVNLNSAISVTQDYSF